MHRFTQLYFQLDETNRTSEKQAALERYFAEAPAPDAAWALYFLTGRKIKRSISAPVLRQAVQAETRYPPWLIGESYDAVGDLAETLALLLPEVPQGTDMPLHRLVEERLLPLRALSDTQKQYLLVQTWRELDTRQKLVWHKLITGEFRVGAAGQLVTRALAAVAGVAPAVMAHRLMGQWEPTVADYNRLIGPETVHTDPGHPYPFYLAHPLEAPPESLGPIDAWQAEWKWDGIRAQLIRRNGQVMLWSRGEELVTDRYPEIRQAAAGLPDGTVLDGEILAYENNRPLPFMALQRRIGRKSVEPVLFADVPVVFMAYDLLEDAGRDIRDQPLEARRARLEVLLAGVDPACALRLSGVVNASGWEELARLQAGARQLAVEGLMLKRRGSVYGVGRQRGDWWKWKIDPYTVDAVLIYAQSGHGRRASLFTDYTFGVWDDGRLVPIAKAYSGLTDKEIREVDAFVRRNTVERHGPFRVVRPELVFELAFESIQASNRHKAGLALRFPRMNRWRTDKKPHEADRLETLRNLLKQRQALAR